MFKKLVIWSQGRHTLFAIYFAGMGSLLAWFHRLDVNFILLVGAIQSFVLGHSIKEDYMKNKAVVETMMSQLPSPPQPEEQAK